MRKYYSIPLIFLVVAAGIGLFLRWQFISPTSGIRYTYFLHGHSHIMFLGWVFNALFLGLIEYHFTCTETRRYLAFFVVLQLLVAAMMISFPLQGYGVYSIVFSTLHTVAVMVFIPVFFRKTSGDTRTSAWFARAAWIFFFLSTAGPFFLGYLMANGLGQSVWYNFSIYYYLHFQYNGFFMFGIFSLFFQMVESKNISFSTSRAKTYGRWMAFACVPAYALSILFAKPGLIFNIIGVLAAVTQLLALICFLRDLAAIRDVFRQRFNRISLQLFYIVITALTVKCILQLVSAHPFVADMAYSLRPVIIAYLHLVLVGIISFFLFAWYLDRQLVSDRGGRWAIGLLLTGFMGSELALVFSPWWNNTAGLALTSVTWIFVLSVPMFVGALVFLLSFGQRQPRTT